MGFITYFRFEAQINFLWSLEYFKVSESFVYYFYIICSLNFP